MMGPDENDGPSSWDEWAAEFTQLPEAPTEPAAADRERVSARIDANEVYSATTQEALILLALAIARLGGSIVLTHEELARPMSLSIDNKHYEETGNLRLSAWPVQES